MDSAERRIPCISKTAMLHRGVQNGRLARLIAAFPNDEQNPELASILSSINSEKHGIHALT